jgi:hypothetical protein
MKEKGDWIAGFTSGKLCGDKVGKNKLIYLGSTYRGQGFNLDAAQYLDATGWLSELIVSNL